MKKTVLVVSVLILICASVVIFFLNKPASNLEKVKKAENTGNYQEALSGYAEALVKSTPTMELPDINNSKFMNGPTWKKQIENYINFLVVPSQKVPAEFSSLITDISRCTSQVEQEIRFIGCKTNSLSEVQYVDEWNKTFFADPSLVDPSQKPMAIGNRVRNVSFVKFSAAKSYTYEITMVNLSTAKAVKFKVYPESSTFLLAIPGENLLICRSSVSFSPGEFWLSGYNVIPVTIPDNASEVSGEFRTSIKKR
jgi:hypothetical protein